jgi:hypothetical protein
MEPIRQLDTDFTALPGAILFTLAVAAGIVGLALLINWLLGDRK